MKKLRFVLAGLMVGLATGAAGADTPPPTEIIPVAPKPAAPLAFCGSNAKTMANWQTHLTLGSNDVVNFPFYGRPELDRAQVRVGPDGRVNYLQAQGVMAAGLTLDELREKLRTELAKYDHKPVVIVTPGKFLSKKIFVLGKVVKKGAYTLDRPLTVLEAVAEAGGLETGIYQLNTVELADLPRSFLIRNRQRVAVDFDKLFQNGDLSQNILLEPDDYLYFPAAGANEFMCWAQ
jgi:protein involved in polysaccharide export with SLBB domain